MSKKRYFTRREVALHNTVDDLWVILYGKVLDLTTICKKHEGDPGVFPLIAFGGKDINHFFDGHGEIKFHVNPDTGKIDAFLPYKSLIGAPTQEEAEKIYLERKRRDETLAQMVMKRFNRQRLDEMNSNFSGEMVATDTSKIEKDFPPWWKDEKYVIGLLTRKSRWIKIRNIMIMKIVLLEVCCENTLEDILQRYLKFNSHARGYTWKYLGQELEMEETLETNGIPEVNEKVDSLKLNGEEYIPTINLYFNDDLVEI